MRQAVLFIHGIGEQRPMNTLRAFVEAVVPDRPGGEEKYWSQPDPLASTYELRRLVTPRRLGTDFFEYYWAHHVRAVSLPSIAFWCCSLILRRKRNVPLPLRTLWRLGRLSLALIALLVVKGSTLPTLGMVSKLPWFVGAAAVGFLQWWTVRYIGDAAQYLRPAPANIAMRQRIREEGVEILRELHEKRKYDRIIVVGHSLGSVIGYDIIRFLWQEYHAQHRSPRRMKQPEIRLISRVGESLRADVPGDADRFQAAQSRLWDEQRAASNPWKVTDFITLGSPLAHAMLLMADSRDDFRRRVRQRELPTCPPVLDDRTYFYWRKPPCRVDGSWVSLGVLHHAAPFAVTRWTNLFFPAHLGLFGDIVGGPLRPVLGPGIKDIAVSTRRWGGTARFLIHCHLMYWRPPRKRPVRRERGEGGKPEALHALRFALDLMGRRIDPAGPPPSPPPEGEEPGPESGAG